MTFEWDAKKAADNLAKHGVTFDDARQAFADPDALVAFDEEQAPGTNCDGGCSARSAGASCSFATLTVHQARSA